MNSGTPGAAGADLRPLLPAVRDQGQRGTCLAFAATAAHEVARMTGAQVEEHLSEEALYWGCKVVDRNWKAGSRFSSAAAALRQTGQPLEEVWPYDSSRKDGVRIDPPSKPTADWHKIDLGPIPTGLDDIKGEIDAGRPVMLGVTIFDSFFRPTAAGRIEIPRAGSRHRGGHAVLAIGHEPAALLIRNSWGPSWGVGGYGWLTNDYFALHGRAAWVVTGPGPAATPSTTEASSGEIYGTG
jgi:C1A family cysteine protease